MASGPRLKLMDTEAEAGSIASTEVAQWDILIDRYLKRRKVERGLSANSFEAYSSDLPISGPFARGSGSLRQPSTAPA